MKQLNEQLIQKTIASIRKSNDELHKSKVEAIGDLNITWDSRLLPTLQTLDNTLNKNLELVLLWECFYMQRDPEEWLNDRVISIIGRQRDNLAKGKKPTVRHHAELEFLEEVHRGISYRQLFIEKEKEL